MTFDIALVLGLLAVAVVLFVIERPRSDVVALLLLGSLAITGLLEPREALSGFSNPAVVTVWAVFILSGGLSRTGVANLVGGQVLKLAGGGETRLMVLIMLVAAVLSAFMNNVGACALLLPVVLNLCRQTGTPPSKLLIPLSFSSLLGGMLTLIGTPPNILSAEAVQARGLGELGLFDFTPVGGAVVVAGILYMTTIGRRLLPERDLPREARTGADLRSAFGLHKRLLILHLTESSPLAGRTLADCRISSALGLTVIGIIRDGRTTLAPPPDAVLRPDDRLLVEGRTTRLEELRESPSFDQSETALTMGRAVAGEVGMVAVSVLANSSFLSKSLRQLNFRHLVGGAVVVAIARDDGVLLSRIDDLALRQGDTLIMQASFAELERLVENGGVEAVDLEPPQMAAIERELMRLEVPEDSMLVGRTLSDSGLAEAFGLLLLTLTRDGKTLPRPGPDEIFEAGDLLVVKGNPEDLEIMRGLQALQVERKADREVDELESASVGLAVVAISPTAGIARSSLRDLHFREKYGLTVLALWRQGRVVRTNLATERLMFGDALLVHGPRSRLRLLSQEADFLVLTEGAAEPPDTRKAPVAIAVMGAVIGATVAGFQPIYIAAPFGAALMVLFGCLSIEQAYREIEWRAVFLIAGMLPMGLAMQKTGAALYIADLVVSSVGGMGPQAILAGLFLLAMAGAQVMPTAATALLLAPIAIDTAQQVDVSPLSLVMAVAVGASTAFISPVTHPANVLVMGPGGYRFVDYVKVGAGLAVVTFAVVVVVVPLAWPL